MKYRWAHYIFTAGACVCCVKISTDFRIAIALWRHHGLRLLREIFTQQTQTPANRNARSKQWQPWLAACQRKRLHFLRFSFTQRMQRKRLRLNENRAVAYTKYSLLIARLHAHSVLSVQHKTCSPLQPAPFILHLRDVNTPYSALCSD